MVNRQSWGSAKLPWGVTYIGRGTPWRNPFKVDKVKLTTRGRMLYAFEEYARARLIEDPDWLEPIRGHDLACYCHPLPCHGDVLLKLLEETQDERDRAARRRRRA